MGPKMELESVEIGSLFAGISELSGRSIKLYIIYARSCSMSAFQQLNDGLIEISAKRDKTQSK